MIILGINAFHPDSSACLLINGEIKLAIEEERVNRIKHYSGLPISSIMLCLKQASIKFSDIDYIAINNNSYSNLLEKLKFSFINFNLLFLFKKLIRKKKKFFFLNALIKEFGEGKDSLKIINVEHHLAHAASAFYESPFEDSVNLSIDGFGDFVSASWGLGINNKISLDEKIFFPHSLGIFYEAFTQFMNFKNFGDEYKMMGLAAYGKPTEKKIVNNILFLKTNGRFELNLKYFMHHRQDITYNWDKGIPKTKTLFSNKIYSIFKDYNSFETNDSQLDKITEFQKNLSSSVQSVYEEAIFNILEYLSKKYKTDNLTLSGGCAQNSLANGKILMNSNFKNLFIPSNPGDGGGALGAAYYVNYYLNNQKKKNRTSGYLGTSFDKNEIEETIKKYSKIFDEQQCKINYYGNFDEICDFAAKKISDKKVIGWFQDEMEWGPRALGNRSILCDPRNPDIKQLLNIKIKKRENFRPFAPSILFEEVSNWFENFQDFEPYMSRVQLFKKEKIKIVPGVAHIDGTGRLQTVRQNDNPKFYKLIKSFYSITNVPILLNTSFNENEPIVHTPEDAIKCFLRTDMDLLVIDNFCIQRAQK
jgi:carbamoyltransferase